MRPIVRWLLAIPLAFVWVLLAVGGAVAQEPLQSPVSLGQEVRARDETFTIAILNVPAEVQRAVVRLSRNGNVYSRDSVYTAPAPGRAEAIITTRIDSKIPLGKYGVVVELDGRPFPSAQMLEIVPPGNPQVRLDEFTPADTDKAELAYFTDADRAADKSVEPTRVASLVLRGAGFQTEARKDDNVFVINGVREPVTWVECPPTPYGDKDKPLPRKIFAQAVSSERIDLCLVPVPANGEIRMQFGVGDRLSDPRIFRVFEMGRGTVVTLAAAISGGLALLPLLLLRTLRKKYAIADRHYRLRLLFLDPETDTYSLSKLQFYLWTVAALFSYAYLFISRVIVQYASWPDVPGTLPGIIAVAAGTSIASQLVTSTKGSKGSGTERPHITDFITSGGVVAPDRLQMLLWTLFGVGAFLVVVLEQHPGRITDLPSVPEGLLYLMGLSSAGYLGGKMARKPGPVINEMSITPTDPDEVITRAAQPTTAEAPDLTQPITSAQAELSALTEPASAHAQGARTALSNAISAVSAAQTTTEINQLVATLAALRIQAEKSAIAAAQDFASGSGTADDAMTAQKAAAALQELSADVTQAIAMAAALPMSAATAPVLIARTISLRGANLSAEALLEIDHTDLPFRMLINAEGSHAPDVVVREAGSPTFARVMRLTIDPAILGGVDLERFQAWFGSGGLHTLTLTNPDGQKTEMEFSLPPGEAQKSGTAA